jgi:hypothetical protein
VPEDARRIERCLLEYLWLPTVDLALGRVAERVQVGGHDVPAEAVRRRFTRGRHNFFTLYRQLGNEPRVAERLEVHAMASLGIADVDGNLEERRHTVLVFNGPAPQVRTFANAAEEIEAVGAWLRTLTADGVQPHEIGVFVRPSEQVSRATAAATAHRQACLQLTDAIGWLRPTVRRRRASCR